ncbi:MAG: SDR family NAD(P)-dependent oxidoreductase [Thermomicrobiales bacterium]
MIDAGLRGRVALVTGGNQGIGAAAVRALAEQSAAVFITYLRLGKDDPGVQATKLDAYASARAQTADALVDEIRSAGGRAAAFEADLADPSVVPVIFDYAEAALGPVEILFNNADTWVADTFLPDAKDDFGRNLTPVTAITHDHSFSVNSRATALLIAEFARRHIARGADWGRIISMTSGGEGGFAREVSYGASKNALESYTQAAAWELGKYGITANILYPPPTDTGWITPEMAAQFASEGPLYHVVQPEDVADVVVFLASHQARFVTGQKIRMW